MQVGDYGVNEYDTGRLAYRGNIQKDGIVTLDPLKPAGSKGLLSVTSINARSVQVAPSAEADAQVAKFTFEVRKSYPPTFSLVGLTEARSSPNGFSQRVQERYW